MQKLNGGYVMIDLNDTNNIYARAKAAIGCGKPIMVFDDLECYYADSISLDGDDNVIIVKGGKTITIESDGDITKTGDVLTIMENIVDANGNKRFTEGDITIRTISGVTQLYGKWSLSGTHLMIVVACSVDLGATLTGGDILCNITLPDYINEKIVALSNTFIVRKTEIVYSPNYSNQSLVLNLKKSASGVFIDFSGNLTIADEDKYFRAQIDLLIDTD